LRRRVTYRPSKGQAAFGLVVGVIFVLIGLTVVIPSFGAFGVLWTLFAVGITIMNGYHAFGKKYIGPEIHIEDEESGMEGRPAGQGGYQAPAPSAEARMQSLQNLYDQGLVTAEEFEAKRREILEEL
jgi:hypothetical protein